MPRGRPRKNRNRDLAPRENSPTFTRDVRIPLSHDEIETKAKELAEATLRRNATAEQAKLVAREARASVKAADAEVAALAAVVATGAETRPIECRTVRHVAAGIVAVVRCDGAPPSEAVVEVRLMDVDEQQLHIGEPLLAEDPALIEEIVRRGRELSGGDGAVPALDHALAILSGETAVDQAAQVVADSAAAVEAFFASPKEEAREVETTASPKWVDRGPDGVIAVNGEIVDRDPFGIGEESVPEQASATPTAESPTPAAPRERDPWEDDEPEATPAASGVGDLFSSENLPHHAVALAATMARRKMLDATKDNDSSEGDLFGGLDAGEEPPAVVEPATTPLPVAQPVGPPVPFPISDATDIDVPLEKVAGVGPVAAKALRAAGFASLRKLRVSDVNDVAMVEMEGGSRVGMKRATEVYNYLEMHYPDAEPDDAIERLLPDGGLPQNVAGAS